MTDHCHNGVAESAEQPVARTVPSSLVRSAALYGAAFLLFFAAAFVLQRAGFSSEMVYDSAYFINSKASLFQQHEWLKIVSIVPARPLFLFTFYLNYLAAGMDPFWFRIGNTLCLACAGLSLTLLAAIVFDLPGLKVGGTALEKRCVAMLLGLLFVAHPLQTNVVLYIWQREAVLACFFYFAALASYLGARSGRNAHAVPLYLLTGVLFLAGMLSKENVATLPAVLVLAELTLLGQTWRQLGKRLVLIGAITIPVAGLYLLVTLGLHGEASEIGKGVLARLAEHYDYAKMSLTSVVLTQCRILFSYLFVTLVPIDPALMRPELVSRSLLDPPSTLLACLALIGLLGLAAGLARKKPLVSFGIVFYVVVLLPESLMIPQYLFFSYRALLPMGGLLLIAGWAALALLESTRHKVPVIATRGALAGLCTAFLLVMGWTTLSVARGWSPITFWERLAAKLPGYSQQIEIVPYLDISMNYMAVLASAQRYEEVMELFKKVANIAGPVDGTKRAREATEKFVTLFGVQSMRAAAGLIGLGAAFSGRNQLPEAAILYERALEIEPHHADVWLSLGAIAETEGDLAKAQARYRKALEIDPYSAPAYQALGSAQFRSGDVRDAVDNLGKAVQLDPKAAAAYTVLAAALEQEGFYPEAASTYRQAAELMPDSADLQHSLGRALAHVGELDGALQAYRRATELNPNDAAAYADLALALDYGGRVQEAIEACRSSLALDPSSASVHNLLGLCLKKVGNLPEAIDAYRQAIALDPALATAYNNLGVALEKSGKPEEAIAEYRKSLERDPHSAITYSNLGVALKKTGQMNEALDQYCKALEVDPTLSAGYANLLTAVEEGADPRKAIEVYRTLLQAQPDSVEANFGMASALLTNKDYAEAIKLFRKVIAVKPDLVQAHARLAAALLNTGDVAEAIVTLGQALALNKENADLFHALGLAFAAMKKPQEAAEQFRKALALEPRHGAARRSLSCLSEKK